ncbi:MAG: 16S rRNA (guanine(527)-N(7))-methyltransferase RsmG [Eubacteriales bacterium]
MTPFSDLYTRILRDAGLDAYLAPGFAEKFEILCNRLIETNERFNLTAITDPEGVILRHFADSLTAEPLIGGSGSVLDVGCGGGFPTLPLAIVHPGAVYTALDSTAKKLTFVDAVSKELALPVRTIAARAEELAILPEHRECYDLVVSRAVARLNILAELCLPFAKVGGRFVALKGAGGEDELDEAAAGIGKLGGRVKNARKFTLPGAGDRVLIEIEKVSPVPKEYPRAFGRIKKRPL